MRKFRQKLTHAYFRIINQYQGFKLIISSCLLISILGFTFLAIYFQTKLHFVDVFSFIWIQYAFWYWVSNWWLLIFFLLFYLSIFYLNGLQGWYSKLFPILKPSPRDQALKLKLRLISKLIIYSLFIITIIGVPILHLSIPRWLRIFAIILPIIISIIPYWLKFISNTDIKYFRRKGQFQYQNYLAFNTASMSLASFEVNEELTRYKDIIGIHPRSAGAIEFMENGDVSSYWRGFKAFFQELGQILGVDETHFTLHETTTKAIIKAIKVVKEECSSPVILSDDLEYKSVALHLDDLKKEGNAVQLLNFRDRIFEKSLSTLQIKEEILEEYQSIIDNKKTPIVILSHVFSETGTVLPITDIARAIRKHSPKAFLIIDGAQAVGNISVNKEIFNLVDFYATSGHKWLMGNTSMGILISNINRMRDHNIKPQKVIDASFPYSHFEYENKLDDRGESTNLDCLISLNTMLQEFYGEQLSEISKHNKILAKLFESLVSSLGIKIITNPIDSGIVLIKLPEYVNTLSFREKLERYKIVTEVIGDKYLRLAFHYFMSSSEVYQLVNVFQEIIGDPTSFSSQSTGEEILKRLDQLETLVIKTK